MPDYVIRIITDKNKLIERSEEINVLQENGKARSIVSDLKDTLNANKELVALCASQIGKPVRIFCVKFADNEIKAFINPMITKSEGMHLSREINPSIPDKEFIMPRNDKIIMAYQTLIGRAEENIFEGVAAEVIQQQVNMLDGILLDDIGLEVLPQFDKAPKKQQKEVIDWWLEGLKAKGMALNEEIQNNEDLLQVKKAIDFMSGVAKGEIKLEKVELEKPKEDKKDARD